MFSHDKFDLSVFVHGDDFVAVGPAKSVSMLESYLNCTYTVKAQVMGSGDGEDKELKILNEIVKYFS